MEPLYKVQARALVDPAAARESAERYMSGLTPSYGSMYQKRYVTRLVGAYLAGLNGEARPYADSNYDRPLKRAHYEGASLRSLLLETDQKRAVSP